VTARDRVELGGRPPGCAAGPRVRDEVDRRRLPVLRRRPAEFRWSPARGLRRRAGPRGSGRGWPTTSEASGIWRCRV